jgi:hypothetical protein|tara:strand:+ start:346 stop:585 length:240 start_codon:yes stop_codon:yes gene_type:complete
MNKKTNPIKDQINIRKVERLNNSSVGNPRWALHTAFGVFKTKSNAACAYEVCTNWEGRLVNIVYEQTPKGKQIISFSHL